MYLPNSFYHIYSKFLFSVMSCAGRIMSSDICRPPQQPHSFDLSLSDVSFDHSVFTLETGKIYVSTFCTLFFLFFPTFFPFQSLLFHPFLHLHLLLASYLIGFHFFEFVFFHHHNLSPFPSFSSSTLSSRFITLYLLLAQHPLRYSDLHCYELKCMLVSQYYLVFPYA